MSFVSRIGNILKQAGSKHTNLELSASNSSLYQAIRCMSSAKLFVGGLSYGTDEMSLKEEFAQYGDVVEARIIMDRETGRSRGFGFVSYTSSEEATKAMQAMNGQNLNGRRIGVNYASEKPRGGGFGGGGFGGGGYGGGGSFNYGGGSSNYGGTGGYEEGGNSYSGGSSRGGGYSGGNYGSGGGGGNGGNYNVAGNGDDCFGGGSGSDSGFASSGYGGTTGAPYGGDEEQLGGIQGGTGGGNEGFGQNSLEGNYRDDFANSRG